MDTVFGTEAVEEAIARYGKPIDLQHRPRQFTGLLHGHGIRISMNGKGESGSHCIGASGVWTSSSS